MFKALSFFLLLSICCISLQAKRGDRNLNKMLDSFEKGIPSYWSASSSKPLQIDTRFYKHGTKSLLWNWEKGEQLNIKRDIAPYIISKKYNDYPGFFCWVYNKKTVKGKIVIEFCKDKKTMGSYNLDLNFTGWKYISVPYYRGYYKDGKHMAGMEISTGVDNIKILAPKNIEKGQLILDAILYDAGLSASLLYFNRPMKVVPEKIAFDKMIESKRRPLTALEKKELDDVFKRTVKMNTALSSKGKSTFNVSRQYKKILRKYKKLKLIRDKNGVYSAAGAALNDPSTWDVLHDDFKNSNAFVILLKDMSRLYHLVTEKEHKQKLASYYCNLYDFLEEQGLTTGNQMWLTWYPGIGLSNGTFRMRDVLLKHGKLPNASSYVRWAYSFDKYISQDSPEDISKRVNMDYFYMWSTAVLMCALSEPDEWKRYNYVKRYYKTLNNEILCRNGDYGGLRPDGSTYHHHGHNYPYTRYCLPPLVQKIYASAGSQFAVSSEAFDLLKKVYLNLRFYSNGELSPNLTGRHPYGRLYITEDPYKLLALSSPALAPGEIDKELASSYLRLMNKKNGAEDFNDSDILPELTPQGNLSMPFASQSVQRRKNWLALVRSPDKYRWTSELSVENENIYGRYQGAGTLDIFYGKTLKDSGYRADGWDWNHYPGATVLALPLKSLSYKPVKCMPVSLKRRDKRVFYLNGKKMQGSTHIYTDRTFVGGLSFNKKNGCFVSDFSEPMFSPGISLKKSYFFLDDCIVALGTDIISTSSQNEVHTTLFQAAMVLPKKEAVTINNEVIKAFPVQRSIKFKNPGVVLDTKSTGYYIFSGQTIQLNRTRQDRIHNRFAARNRKIKKFKFSTAWLNHGKKPEKDSYRYIVFPDSTPKKMNAFAKAMSNTTTAPIEIVKQDNDAHIVFDRRNALWSGALFKSQKYKNITTKNTNDPAFIIKSNSIPCLFMMKTDSTGNNVELTVADPDMHANLIEGYNQFTGIMEYKKSTLVLLLSGKWIISGADNVKFTYDNSGNTKLKIDCKHGESYNLKLKKLSKGHF